MRPDRDVSPLVPRRGHRVRGQVIALVVLAVLTTACSDDSAAPPSTTVAPGPDLRGQLLIVGSPIEPVSEGEQQFELALVPMSDPDSAGVDLGQGTFAQPVEISPEFPRREGSSVTQPVPVVDPLVLEVYHGDLEASTCVEVALTELTARAEAVECPHGDPPLVVGRWAYDEAEAAFVDGATGERSEPDAVGATEFTTDVSHDAEAIALLVRDESGSRSLDLLTQEGRRTVLEPPAWWQVSAARFDPTGTVLIATAARPGGDFHRMVRIPVSGGAEEVLFEREMASWTMGDRTTDNLVVFRRDETDGRTHVLRADATSGPLREVAVLPSEGHVSQLGRRPGSDDLWLVVYGEPPEDGEPIDSGEFGLYALPADGDLQLVAEQPVVEDGVVVSDDGEMLVAVVLDPADPGGGYERARTLVARSAGEVHELVTAPHVRILDLEPDGSAVVYSTADDLLGTGRPVGAALWRLDLTEVDAEPQKLDDRHVESLLGGRGFQEWANVSPSS